MRKSLSVLFVLVMVTGLLLTGCSVGDDIATVLPNLTNATVQVPTPPVQTVVNGQQDAAVVPTMAAPTQPAIQAVPEQIVDYQQQLIDLYDNVNPAVVMVLMTSGSGSGFVIDPAGYIVTNNHVVEEGGPIVVRFYNGDTRDAELVGADPSADIAVIKVDAQPGELVTVAFGDSDSLDVGQLVVAIGSPFGYDNSMTTGIVSALSRNLPSEAFTGLQNFVVPNIIQTDAAINPGNSGGPLLNLKGEVIGVNTEIASTVRANSGVGFAVPSNVVKVIVEQLRGGGEVHYPWLGISGGSLTSEAAQEMNLPADQRGVLVATVTAGGPADEAGLRGGDQTTGLGGDVITAINDLTVTQFDDLLGYIVQQTRVGQTITLTILRDGQTQTIDITLGERPVEVPQG